MKAWIKGGIIVAVAYTILNLVLFFWGMGCGYSSASAAFPCNAITWSYWNLFALEHIEESLPLRSVSSGTWLLLMVLIDGIIGFTVGALLTKGIGKFRSRK